MLHQFLRRMSIIRPKNQCPIQTLPRHKNSPIYRSCPHNPTDTLVKPNIQLGAKKSTNTNAPYAPQNPLLMEMRGFEPLTSSVQGRRSPI